MGLCIHGAVRRHLLQGGRFSELLTSVCNLSVATASYHVRLRSSLSVYVVKLVGDDAAIGSQERRLVAVRLVESLGRTWVGRAHPQWVDEHRVNQPSAVKIGIGPAHQLDLVPIEDEAAVRLRPRSAELLGPSGAFRFCLRAASANPVTSASVQPASSCAAQAAEGSMRRWL
jgi:hypothetical protein